MAPEHGFIYVTEDGGHDDVGRRECMLVLSRKQGQRIVIGNGIEVRVLAVRGNRVQLGFSAPVEVQKSRQEVAMRVDRARNRETPEFA
jgi:carbon storage regulator